jgi:hypothetical protein
MVKNGLEGKSAAKKPSCYLALRWADDTGATVVTFSYSTFGYSVVHGGSMQHRACSHLFTDRMGRFPVLA